MKVLVISRNAWDNTNSIGNTLSNFFHGVNNIEVANIYFRSSRPNNTVCDLYYHVTEGEILRNWFSPQKSGGKLIRDRIEVSSRQGTAERNEQSFIKILHSHNFQFAYKISNYLWNSRKWINGNLEQFVREFAPDVVFSFVKSAPQYYLTIQHLRERFHIPLFTWIADDEYTGLLQRGQTRDIDRLKYILKESAVVSGCSRQICDYYNKIFGCKAFPLYKSCDFSGSFNEEFLLPIKIIYAGNLLYGRLEIIRAIAEALEKYDEGKGIVRFDIYSNTTLTESDRLYFERFGCTKYYGRQPYDMVVKHMNDASVVLHAESFEMDQILKTRYSFSTKIIDCLQSGRVLLAVGPKELASIDYVKRIPGTCVIDDLKGLLSQLGDFLDDYASFPKRALQIREFAREWHDSVRNSEIISNLLEKIVKGDT